MPAIGRLMTDPLDTMPGCETPSDWPPVTRGREPSCDLSGLSIMDLPSRCLGLDGGHMLSDRLSMPLTHREFVSADLDAADARSYRTMKFF